MVGTESVQRFTADGRIGDTPHQGSLLSLVDAIVGGYMA